MIQDNQWRAFEAKADIRSGGEVISPGTPIGPSLEDNGATGDQSAPAQWQSRFPAMQDLPDTSRPILPNCYAFDAKVH